MIRRVDLRLMPVITVPRFKTESRRLRFAAITIVSGSTGVFPCQNFMLKGKILHIGTVSWYLVYFFDARTEVCPQLIFEVT